MHVGIVGFSDRARSSLIPSFEACAAELGFDVVGVSDIWKRRREEGVAYFQQKYGQTVKPFHNNEELYDSRICDAVIVATADFQHVIVSFSSVSRRITSMVLFSKSRPPIAKRTGTPRSS